jgi:hypothetical protein
MLLMPLAPCKSLHKGDTQLVECFFELRLMLHLLNYSKQQQCLTHCIVRSLGWTLRIAQSNFPQIVKTLGQTLGQISPSVYQSGREKPVVTEHSKYTDIVYFSIFV